MFLKLSLKLQINICAGVRSSHWRGSVSEGVLRNFAKFIGKLLYQSLFFNKVALLKKEVANKVAATLLK